MVCQQKPVCEIAMLAPNHLHGKLVQFLKTIMALQRMLIVASLGFGRIAARFCAVTNASGSFYG